MKRFLLYLVLTIGALLFLYPFVWMLGATLKPEMEIAGFNPVSSHFTLENYRFVFNKIPIIRGFGNSLLVSIIVTTSVVLFGSMVGYALSRLHFRGREMIFNLALATMMIPAQLTLIPLYTMMVKFGWVNSYLALIVPAMMSSYAVLLFRQFFLSIPQSLIEAARLDGCSDWRILFTIVYPLSKPAIMTVAILTFMGAPTLPLSARFMLTTEYASFVPAFVPFATLMVAMRFAAMACACAAVTTTPSTL